MAAMAVGKGARHYYNYTCLYNENHVGPEELLCLI